MSVYLKPCTGCPLRSGCEQRDDFRKRVSGLGLRSATFNCGRLRLALSPGTRITISHPIAALSDREHAYSPEFEIIRVDLPATITSSKDDKFSCVVDRDALLAAIEDHEADAEKVDIYRFRRAMSHRRIVKFLDEPRRTICECGHVRLADGRCDRRPDDSCWRDGLAGTPQPAKEEATTP